MNEIQTNTLQSTILCSAIAMAFLQKRLLFSILIFTPLYFVAANLSAQERTIIPTKNNIAERQFVDSPPILRFSVPDDEVYRPKVALVLSGGGARGLAQIGVIKQLEKAGISIDYIVGTSVGAVVGGLYAVGYDGKAMDSIMRKVDWDAVFSLRTERERHDVFLDQRQAHDQSILTLRFNNFRFVFPESVSEGARYTELLQRLLWQGSVPPIGNFDSLHIPFRAVATDIAQGKPVVLRQGSLSAALRASSTIPLRYAPVRIDSMILVDGGVLSNLPIDIAEQEFHPDFIIAVNTTSPLHSREELNKPWIVADQVVGVLMRKIMPNYPSSQYSIIAPELGRRENTDFSSPEELMQIGEEAAESAIPDILFRLQQLRHTEILSRRLSPQLAFGAAARSAVVNFDNINTLPVDAKRREMRTPENLVELIDDIHAVNDIKSLEIAVSETSAERNISIAAIPYPSIRKYNAVGDVSEIEKNEIENLLSPTIAYHSLSPTTTKNLHREIGLALNRHGWNFTDAELEYIPEGILNISIRKERLLRLEIHGAQEYSTSLIERIAGRKKNYLQNMNNMLDIWETISGLGKFSDVELDVVDSSLSEHKYYAKMKVKEFPEQALRIALRIDNERNTQLGLNFSQESFLLSGSVFSAILMGGGRNQRAELQYEIPSLWGSDARAKIAGYVDWRNIYLYSSAMGLPISKFERTRSGEIIEQRQGTSIFIGQHIDADAELFGQFRYEQQRLYNQDLSGGIQGFRTLGLLKIGARFDSKNHSYFSTSGRILDMSLETTLLATQNALSFSKASFFQRSYYTFGGITLSPSANFGFSDHTTPIPEFFSIGGEDNFYGLRENDERGRQIAVASLESRIKLPIDIVFDTYLSARYDVGGIWEQFQEIRLSTLRHGVGFALGLDTPIGPALFSVGQSFYFLKNPGGAVLGPLMAYFSIGARI